MRQREPAICVRTIDYSETSQVLHFFTRGSGMVHLLAKGTKRPKSKSGGAVDMLSEGELVFIPSPRGALGTLVEFTETAARAGLRSSAERLYSALYMIELVGDMLAEADPHPEVFDLLHNSLARLAQEDAQAGAVLAYFQWRLLALVGLLGQLQQCVGCGRAMIGAAGPAGPAGLTMFFCSSLGGLVCGGCQQQAADKYRLDAPAQGGLGVLAALAAGKRPALPQDQARALNRLLAYHISYQLGKALKLARYAIG